ncbi:MAG: type IX secretion system protein PorG [Chitinophagaceae bacterium]
MKTRLLLLAILFLPLLSIAQESDIGVIGGMSNYHGTLQAKQFTFFESHPSLGFFYKKEIQPRLSLRFMLTFAQISGDDHYSPDSNLVLRNLSFHSNITEFQTGLEYNFLDLTEYRFTPYIFIGVAVFHFKPTALDTAGKRVDLQSLNTEGEGLKEYPSKKAYSLTQISIPFGGGIKFAINDHILLGVEFDLRKTFTGYLDDVNGTYADQSILLSERGPEAVSMAFRTNRLPGHSADPYPVAGTLRGTGRGTDWYYSAGITLAYRFGSSGGFGGSANGKDTKEVRCPSNK